jgi:bacillithiol synthase
MQVVCKRHTELPHTSKLFSDLLYHFDKVSAFYPHPPLDPNSLKAVAKALSFPSDRRAQICSVLREQNGDSESLRTLAQDGTVAVLTGQQVGLFSGPSYTIYKALTAARLARNLTESGIPAVPIFWLATEDHDLAEVSSCWTFKTSQEPVLLKVGQGDGADRPVGGIRIDSAPVDELLQSLEGFPFGDEIGELVRNSYAPGRTFGESFSTLLRSLLGEYNILFFDPMHAGGRKVAAPFLRQTVEAAPHLTERLLERNRKLNDAGYHAQVHVEKDTSLFFLLEDGHRIALRRRNGEYQAKDRRITASELMDRSESLSPNALLRPVVQDYMFPTVAYIGGPAELAYLAQSEVIYASLLGRMPVAVPRNGFTLIDDKSRKLLHRYGLHLDSFFEGEEHLAEKIAANLVPVEVAAAIEQVASQTESHLESLEQTIGRFDPTLGAAMTKSAAKIQYQLTKIQKKVAREALRRNQRAQEEGRHLYNAIYPHKHLQERFYTILPFLARHGTDVIDRIFDCIHTDCPDHHLLYL